MSREMSDIYDALMAAQASNEALSTWVRTADGHDIVRSRRGAIQDGIAAYHRLQGQLRDGHMHIEVPEAARERGPVAANLTKADDGCRLCDTCEGVGVTMIAAYEGGAHVEKDGYCPDCNGDGQVEVTS
jgi:hypothetical protein